MGEESWTFEELVDPGHTAVLVIDMQNDFCSEKGALSGRGVDTSSVREMAPVLAGFLTGARSSGVQIIHTRNIHSGWTDSPVLKRRKKDSARSTVIGTWGAEWFEKHEEFTPCEGEYVIAKYRYSAFIGTNLEQVLHARGIRALIMTGTTTNVCVESTARDGSMLDFHVVLLSDCTATGSGEAIYAATLKNIDAYFGTVTTSDSVMKAWAGN